MHLRVLKESICFISKNYVERILSCISVLYMTLTSDWTKSFYCHPQEPQWWQWRRLMQTIPQQTTPHCATTLSGSHQKILPPRCSTSTQKEATFSLPFPLCYWTERWADLKTTHMRACVFGPSGTKLSCCWTGSFHKCFTLYVNCMSVMLPVRTKKGREIFAWSASKWAGAKARWVSLHFYV